MEKKIFVIDDTESFIVSSIVNNLNNLGHIGEIIPWSKEKIASNKDYFSDVVLAYIDDPDDIDQDALQYLMEVCSEKNNLYLAGREDDIEEIKNANKLNSIAGAFYRPINATDVAEKIDRLTSGNPIKQRNHILVVDDSGTMLTTMQEWLGDKYRVSVVNSAMNAISFLTKSIPDLILLDYEMPGCSGPQLLEMLRADENTAKIPVIFLTGKNDSDSVKRVLMLKPEGYLLKNMSKEHIIERVDDFFKTKSNHE